MNINGYITLILPITPLQEDGVFQDRQSIQRRRLGCIERRQGFLPQPDWCLCSHQDEGDSGRVILGFSL